MRFSPVWLFFALRWPVDGEVRFLFFLDLPRTNCSTPEYLNAWFAWMAPELRICNKDARDCQHSSDRFTTRPKKPKLKEMNSKTYKVERRSSDIHFEYMVFAHYHYRIFVQAQDTLQTDRLAARSNGEDDRRLIGVRSITSKCPRVVQLARKRSCRTRACWESMVRCQHFGHELIPARSSLRRFFSTLGPSYPCLSFWETRTASFDPM